MPEHVSFPIVLFIVGIMILSVALILALDNLSKKFEMYDIIEKFFWIIAIFYVAGFILKEYLMYLYNDHFIPLMEKFWNKISTLFLKIRNFILGERIIFDGLVIEINEEKMTTYFNNDSSDYVHDTNSFIERPYCLIKILKETLNNEVIIIRIMDSKKGVNDNFKLSELTKVRIDCLRRWYNKDFCYLKKILQTD